MSLFNGVISISNIYTLLFVVFAVLLLGYALGRITIKGVSLGDAGVFVVALLFGALLVGPLEAQLVIKGETETVNFMEKALEVVEQLGLILFVTSVGFIAGPKFFGNMKKNFKSYVFLGLIIIIAGGVSANSRLRKRMTDICNKKGWQLYMPELSLCGDNAAMVGAQGYYEFLSGKRAGNDSG